MKDWLIRNHHVRWGAVLLLSGGIIFVFCFATWGIAKIAYYTIWTDSSVVYQAEAEDFDLGQAVSSYLLIKPADRVPLSAGAYLVSDLNSKEKIIKKNESRALPIASVTKLMTALVGQEMLKPDQMVTVTREAWGTYGDTGHLKVGEKLPFSAMLYPLLLTSSNDAAEAIAITAGREHFIRRMNERARELGMTDTHFEDPSGLSPQNISTPNDLFKLISYIYQNKKDLLAITCEKYHRLGGHYWSNYNNVALMKYYIGGKNGYTEEANRTLVSLFEVPISNASSTGSSKEEKRNRLLAVVLLQSDDKKKDTKNLLNFISRYASFTGKNGFIPTPPKVIDNLPKT